MDERAAELRDSLGMQTAIVVLPAIDTKRYTSAKAFATELFNHWGIGDSQSNNGLLILLLTADGEREVVFETGYGLGETLTDGLSKLIQSQKMIPFLKEGEYGEGLIAGIEEVEKVLRGTSDLIKEPVTMNDMKWPLIIWLVVGVLALFLSENRKKKTVAKADSPYKAAIALLHEGAGMCHTVLFFPVFLLASCLKEERQRRHHPMRAMRRAGHGQFAKGEPAIKRLPYQIGQHEGI